MLLRPGLPGPADSNTPFGPYQPTPCRTSIHRAEGATYWHFRVQQAWESRPPTSFLSARRLQALRFNGQNAGAPRQPSPVEQLFLERLPEDIRIQLVDTKIEDHRQLAKWADALWTCRDTGMESNATQPPAGQKQLKTKPSPAERLCFYHRTFGEDARQCRQPCTWLGNEEAGRQ